jgi:selenophosphate synthase
MRAAASMRIAPRDGDGPQAFGSAFEAAVDALPSAADGAAALPLDVPLALGQVHAVTSPDPLAAFAAFEFYGPGRGPSAGWAAASTDSLQVTDATLDPLAEEHVAAAVAAASARTFALGACARIEVCPTFDAPGGKAKDALAASYVAAARRLGGTVVERAALGRGKLFIGATVVARSDRQVPNRHHVVKRGMEVLVTRPLGDLAPLAVYLACLSDEDYLRRAEAAGLPLDVLRKAREGSSRALRAPAIEAARVIHDLSPPFREPPDLERHLAATAELGPRGLVGLCDFAARFGVDVRIEAVPLLDRRISAFSTDAHLMDNATASAPGALALVGAPAVIDEARRALEVSGLEPAKVGSVTRRGGGEVTVAAA